MAFITREPTNFMSIRLTNIGRRMLSLGKLKFSYAALSDREIDYRFGLEVDYDHSCNRVLTTVGDAPPLPFANFDGTPPISLDGNVYSDKKVITAATSSFGIFSGISQNDTFSGYVYNTNMDLGSGRTTFMDSMDGTDVMDISSAGVPSSGLVGIVGLKGYYSNGMSMNDLSCSAPNTPLWYRYSSITSTTLGLDRKLPLLENGTLSIPNDPMGLFFIPWSGSDSYYGTGATTSSPVWNLNIVRTSSEIGTSTTEIKYNRYGSIQYAGAKLNFGFDRNTRAVGFVHYSNSDTGNTYGEQFIPNSTIVDLPMISWHKFPSDPGQAAIKGLRLTDANSVIYFDEVAGTPYTLLKEDQIFGSDAIARMYFKLKIIVITDQELLAALSYKSNRNWTLPPLNISLVKDPRPPLSNLTASGLCESGKTYYVTYRTISNQLPVDVDTSYGFAPSMHCCYIQKIKGYTDENGLSYYLSATFPNRSFPYMRGSADMANFSGTGWNSNGVQLLVAKVDDADDRGVGYIPTDSWRAISNINIGGNGIFSGDATTNYCIEPESLQAHRFIISENDYASGTTYDLAQHYPDFFTRTDYQGPPRDRGLTYGNEALFPGVIRTVMAATVYKTTWKVVATDADFNSSLNNTFDGTKNKDTYITEIGIFDEQQRMVGVAKPTWPIKKNQARYLTFELEYDF